MVQALIESMRYNDGKFPSYELEQLILNKDEATPPLLSIVKEAITDPDIYINEPSRMDHLYALYLLAQFRETQLFPLLIELLNLPYTIVDSLLGDCITEGSGRMLASVYNGDIESIKLLIENEEVDEFVRGQGLLAMTVLVLQGSLDRERIIHYFQELLDDEKLNDEYPLMNSHIISSIVDLHPQESYEQIKSVFEKETVDSMMIDLEDVNRVHALSKEEVLEDNKNDLQFKFIEDTVREMEWWACFKKDQKKKKTLLKPAQPIHENHLNKNNPAIKLEKIGRNEPCLCGSGKKYKKCCGIMSS